MRALQTLLLCGTILGITPTFAQEVNYGKAMAETAMHIWPDSLVSSPGKPAKWTYEQTVMLRGIEGVWRQTGDGKYFAYIQKSMDFFIDEKGNIRTYKLKDYNIDNTMPGGLLLTLYEVTGKKKYLLAAQQLRQQLQEQPRTKAGGFWHKKIYPYQMWLDGLYMGEPFYTAYTKYFGPDSCYNDIARQFELMERFSIDQKTGLMYHGYDESREQKWSNPQTGKSPHVWARAMGWYGMALVDVLENFPANHPKRPALVAILNRYATTIAKHQHATSLLWYNILDKPGEARNYFESSASAMFIYTFLKGTRLGVLPVKYRAIGEKAYVELVKNFVQKNGEGYYDWHGTVAVSGLGGTPYRDGSYDYYMGEKVVVNDAKGMGAFIQAANEINWLHTQNKPTPTVTLDYFYNHEIDSASGQQIHYTWEQQSNGGFSQLGDIFQRYGARIQTLKTKPTSKNLQHSDIYIIVDPDNAKESNSPELINTVEADVIAKWVKAGGVLVLLGNDVGNMEFKHFNALAERFGLHFNEDSHNRVTGKQFEMGAISVPAQHAIFQQQTTLYMKEVASITTTQGATPLLVKDGITMMAMAKYGKGTVVAVGDPWLYNEYVDGRKLPQELNNYKPAEDFVQWLIAQTKGK
ncbi:unsaturated rhamnogalacturonyl hydrolase [Chitinophaga skermanii]|uniref:Unsaturated rhamnogalacturonyl hydrolase n=1 Tax=Chitinophaga skermanii TaxID=331697 RepID=A0A327QLW3_9BACT|nr:glycoside hydrolase family 88 protein [Chitinophaga skermanii]RAJ05320.1 unsaturated rhamnogalacturonyl hydrolase [Chitinophaga skermanii]